MKIMNAFSLNMINFDGSVDFRTIGWDEADRLIKEGESCIGHPDLAEMLGVEMNRIAVHLEKGESALVIQRVADDRLPEGAKELPDGTLLVPKLITVN